MLLRMYSSRKKSSATVSPSFHLSVISTPQHPLASVFKISFVATGSRWSVLPLMSPPAQNAFSPAPEMITILLYSSLSHSCQQWPVKRGGSSVGGGVTCTWSVLEILRTMLRLSALRAFGRLRVIVPTDTQSSHTASSEGDVAIF